MTVNVKDLGWLRNLKIPDAPEFGARMHGIMQDLITSTSTIEQQGNFNASGNPPPPPMPQGFTVTPHETGFDVSVQHDGEFYRGVEYHLDYADNPGMAGARTHTSTETRNFIAPLGNRTFWFQLRCKYPYSDSTSPIALRAPVTGGIAQTSLLPTQGCGTTLRGQPPHLQPPFRGAKPPVRTGRGIK